MKSIAAILTILAANLGNADIHYFGVYFHGTKIGFASEDQHPADYKGHPAVVDITHNFSSVTVGGCPQSHTLDHTSWSTPDNVPLAEEITDSSGGRTVTYKVVYGPKSVEVLTDTGSMKISKSIPYPVGPLLEDLGQAIRQKVPEAGQTLTCWRFSYAKCSFERLELKTTGPATYQAGGRQLSARLTESASGGAVIRTFTSPDGVVIRQESPSGEVAQLEPKDEAMAAAESVSPLEVLSFASLQSDQRIKDANSLRELKLRFSGADLSKIGFGETQVVEPDGADWIVDVRPARISNSTAESISDAAKGAEQWTKPDLYLPTTDPVLIGLAHKIVGNKNALQGSLAIMHYVHGYMRAAYGYGVRQDALAILHNRTGACTEYTILTTALLRAAGIPARIVTGLVTSDGTFRYHAWSEAWDGKRWIGIDSVLGDDQLSACHIKLGEGSFESATGFEGLDPAKTKIEVLAAIH